MSTQENTQHDDHSHGIRQYVVVWITLMALTVLTVWSAGKDLGGYLNITVAMVIASVKAGIVALYFMHLKFEDKLTWVYAIYPLFLLFLLIGFTMFETFTRIPAVD
ncbi:MAG: cytochrome-c oxidase [Candidatus Mycalebacterium zealandia]|nr:MAG: cytochrome-c oxidase [Candidatus Mycalebacterium zealandia]